MSKVGWIRLAIVVGAVGLLEILCQSGVIRPMTMIPPSRMAVELWKLAESGKLAPPVTKTLGNVAAAFVLSVALGLLLAGDGRRLLQGAGALVWSIIPISMAYHFSHYLTALVVNGQYALAALSDPLMSGADLFGGLGRAPAEPATQPAAPTAPAPQPRSTISPAGRRGASAADWPAQA
mgnify:CR=1 FL=1